VFEQLRAMRIETNTPAKTLANMLGLKTKAAYYKKECGSVSTTVQEAKQLADYFGRTIEDLFFGNEVSSQDTNMPQSQYTAKNG
jgi:putative transcriptional regulator